MRYEKPNSATLEEWGEWREDTQSNYPIQYFFRETVTGFFHFRWFVIRQYWWMILHRVVPEYRYHVIKPRTLEPGYHPTDVRIRAAAFDLMSEYAETLMGDGIKGTKWNEEDIPDTDENGRSVHLEQVEHEAEIIELRNWWVDYRPRRDVDDVVPYYDGKPEGAGDSWFLSGDRWSDTPEYAERKKYIEKAMEVEKVFDMEDETKFMELVKLLPYMYD